MTADAMRHRAEKPPTQQLFHDYGTIYFSQKSQMTGMCRYMCTKLGGE